MRGQVAVVAIGLVVAGVFTAQPACAGQATAASSLSPEQTARFARGVEALKQGQLDVADEAFRDVLRAGGELSFVHHNLGVVLDQRRRPAAALAEFRAAIRLNPAYGPAHLLAGTSLLALKRPREALVYLQKAERLMPAEVLAPARQAEAYEQLGDLARVVDSLRRSCALAPTDPEYTYRVGQAYVALARWSIERLRAVNPQSTRLPQLLARTLMEQGETSRAIQALQSAASADPSAPEVHLALAQLYLRANQLDMAAESVTKELAIAPESRAALALRAQITQARTRNP